MTTFKLGDRVKIKQSSIFYRKDSESNPRGVEGVITATNLAELLYRVRWDNGRWNTYKQASLEWVSLERLMDEFIKEDKANA